MSACEEIEPDQFFIKYNNGVAYNTIYGKQLDSFLQSAAFISDPYRFSNSHMLGFVVNKSSDRHATVHHFLSEAISADAQIQLARGYCGVVNQKAFDEVKSYLDQVPFEGVWSVDIQRLTDGEKRL